MLGFIKSSHYIRFIRVNFIDQPIKGNNMSLKAIDEMVRNIQLFIESSGAHYLQPITEIVALHPIHYLKESAKGSHLPLKKYLQPDE